MILESTWFCRVQLSLPPTQGLDQSLARRSFFVESSQLRCSVQARRMVKRSAQEALNAKSGKKSKLTPNGILKQPSASGSKSTASKQFKQVKAVLPSGKANDPSLNGPSSKSKGKAKAADNASTRPEPSSIQAATAFEVIAGSYERLLYGLHCTLSGTKSSTQVDMQPIFQFPAHLSAVKTAAASPNGKYLVTGAADEVIKVWDLRRRKEIGGLLGHEGDITSLTFSSDKYLVSTSADGTLSLFRTKDWSVLRKFKGHIGRVNHVSVHPQGRVALSVGKDRCLRMWDLLGRSSGKSSMSTKLGAEAELVRWSADGTKFAVLLDRQIRFFTTDLVHLATISSTSRFHDVQFLRLHGQEVVFIGCEDKKVRIYTFEENDSEDEDAPPTRLSPFAELVGHENRVKAINIVRISEQDLAITISSDGKIRIFSLNSVQEPASDIQVVQALQSFDTKGSRLTCLSAVAVANDRMSRGRQNANDTDSEDSEGSEDSDEGSQSEDDAGELGEETEDEEETEVVEEEWGGIEDE